MLYCWQRVIGNPLCCNVIMIIIIVVLVFNCLIFAGPRQLRCKQTPNRSKRFGFWLKFNPVKSKATSSEPQIWSRFLLLSSTFVTLAYRVKTCIYRMHTDSQFIRRIVTLCLKCPRKWQMLIAILNFPSVSFYY